MAECDSVSLTRVKPAAREDREKGFTEARGTDFGVELGRRRVGKGSSMASWRTAAAIADCDSVSLTRVKPASTATNYSRREREVEEEAAVMSVRAPPPPESRGDDGDRDAKAFPHAHICASKG